MLRHTASCELYGGTILMEFERVGCQVGDCGGQEPQI